MSGEMSIAVDLDAAVVQRQGDPARPDAELQCGAATSGVGEEAHGRLEDTGVVHVGRGQVVALGHPAR